MDIIQPILWCALIFLDGMNAGCSFRDGRTGSGILWIVAGLCWAALLCLKVIAK